MEAFTRGTVALLAGVAVGCSPGTGTAPQAPTESAAQVGARLFNGNCVSCHQQSGAGLPGVYPSLAGSPVVNGDPAPLAAWVIQGVRPAGMPAGRYSTVMPHFGWLKARDAAALLTYLRSSFGNAAPAVDAAVIDQALGAS